MSVHAEKPVSEFSYQNEISIIINQKSIDHSEKYPCNIDTRTRVKFYNALFPLPNENNFFCSHKLSRYNKNFIHFFCDIIYFFFI